MPKLGELNYVKALSREDVEFALKKPFGDGECGRYLADLGRIMELLPPVPARVLDLGVGTGWTSVFLARRGYDVVGQDICPEMIDLANRNRERYGADSVAFVVQDYESMAFREEFDAAVFYDALHHAEDERVALAGVYAALKPDGVCLTIEPGEGHAVASAHTAEKYGVTEKDMPPHHIIALGRELGFRQFRVYPRAAAPGMMCWFDRTRPLWSPRPGRWQIAARFARKAVRALVRGVRDSDRGFLCDTPPETELRNGNLVWLQK